MSNFLIEVSWNAPYPKQSDYRVEAWAIPTAVARALRKWKKENARKRIDRVKISIVKL